MSYKLAYIAMRDKAHKALCRGTYVRDSSSYNDGDVCALAAVSPQIEHAASRGMVGNSTSIAELAGEFDFVMRALRALGLTADEAQLLQQANDEYEGTDEGRYFAVMDFLRAGVESEGGLGDVELSDEDRELIETVFALSQNTVVPGAAKLGLRDFGFKAKTLGPKALTRTR